MVQAEALKIEDVLRVGHLAHLMHAPCERLSVHRRVDALQDSAVLRYLQGVVRVIVKDVEQFEECVSVLRILMVLLHGVGHLLIAVVHHVLQAGKEEKDQRG